MLADVKHFYSQVTIRDYSCIRTDLHCNSPAEAAGKYLPGPLNNGSQCTEKIIVGQLVAMGHQWVASWANW